MIETKSFSGYCPTQEKEYSVNIDYVCDSTLYEVVYEKGAGNCKYNMYGDKCKISCPIINAAPETL